MKKNELKNMDKKLLLKEVNDIKKDLFNLRLNLAAGQVKDYSQFKKLRKSAARAMTVLREKNLIKKDFNG